MDQISSLLPPQSTETEMCTLGAMLLSEKACEEVQTILQPVDFYHPAHREIFKSIHHLMLRGSAVDLVTVKNELINRDLLERVGGIDYLIQIAESVPSSANAKYYAQIVANKASERRLEEAGTHIIKLSKIPDYTVEEKIDKAEQAIFEIGRNRLGKYFSHVKTLARSYFDDVDTLYEGGSPILGTPSGYFDLDDMTGGFYPGDFVIVAARPSMGKTCLAMNFAINVANHTKKNVAVFSLEMSGKQLVTRMVSMLSGVGMSTIKKTHLASEDYDRLADACELLYGLPIYIDDTSDVSPLEMRGKCRRLKQDGGLSMVIVDYLQLMRASRRTENRVQEISEIARSLKQLAKELEVPVVALSQLNRGVESRDDKRPMLSDIRESGSIEAEADLVGFIYRDAYYKAKEVNAETTYDPLRVEEAELIIGKSRNGPTGKILLGFQPACVRFMNLKKT